jgi:transposase
MGSSKMKTLVRQLMAHSSPTSDQQDSKVNLIKLLQLRAQQIDMTKRSIMQMIEACDMTDPNVAARIRAFVCSEKAARKEELELLERCESESLASLALYADAIARNRKLETNRFQAILLEMC